jgi:hypothetical protein
MRLQQAFLHPHPMESNPAWAQTGVTMLSRINLHRVRAQYQPAARLERPLLVSSVWREVPNARRFQGQTCSVSCDDFKNIYIWYPDQDQSRVFWRSTKSTVFSREQNRVITFFFFLNSYEYFYLKKTRGGAYARASAGTTIPAVAARALSSSLEDMAADPAPARRLGCLLRQIANGAPGAAGHPESEAPAEPVAAGRPPLKQRVAAGELTIGISVPLRAGTTKADIEAAGTTLA